MKKLLTLIGLLVLLSLACSLPLAAQAANPTADRPPAITPPGEPITATPSALPATPTPAGIPVKTGNFAFVIPNGLASGATTQVVARAEGDQVSPWDIAPEHQQILLDHYLLEGHFQKPQIYIYPVQDYLTLNQGLADTFQKIQNASSNPGALSPAGMPGIPFFNAGQIFAARMQALNFKNGSGVRLVTQYAQAFVSINNQELFYHYQGLSSDGKYYIIAILPVTAPMLAADEKPESPVPADGVPFNYNDSNFDFPGYVKAVSAKLDAASPDDFSPSLNLLDALIQSFQVLP